MQTHFLSYKTRRNQGTQFKLLQIGECYDSKYSYSDKYVHVTKRRKPKTGQKLKRITEWECDNFLPL